MFEQSLEETTVTIFVSDKDAQTVDENGCTVARGPLKLTFVEAVELVTKLDHLILSVPKWQLKRFRSFRNQVVFAFGPDFESFIARNKQ